MAYRGPGEGWVLVLNRPVPQFAYDRVIRAAREGRSYEDLVNVWTRIVGPELGLHHLVPSAMIREMLRREGLIQPTTEGVAHAERAMAEAANPTRRPRPALRRESVRISQYYDESTSAEVARPLSEAANPQARPPLRRKSQRISQYYR